MVTLQNRVSIQLLILNSDVSRFQSVFNSTNARYILLALSLFISILIGLGRLVELHQMILSDTRIIETIILGRILYWVATSLLGGRL